MVVLLVHVVMAGMHILAIDRCGFVAAGGGVPVVIATADEGGQAEGGDAGEEECFHIGPTEAAAVPRAVGFPQDAYGELHG
jgi:hypothetical protein